MADREGLWDCPSCGHAGIPGFDLVCPNCGKSRGEVKFYLPDNARVLTSPDEIARAHAGADWVCRHCDAAVPATKTICPQCGAERGTSPSRPVIHYEPGETPRDSDDAAGKVDLEPATQDVLIDWHRDDINFAEADVPEIPVPRKRKNDDPPKWKNDWGKRPNRNFPLSGQQVTWILGILLVIALIAGGLYMFLHTKEVQTTVDHFEWMWTISIDEYRTMREEGWDIPVGGRYVSQREKVHHTEQYACGTEMETETYACGSHEESCGTSDNGNGSFSDCTRNVTDYCEREVSVTKYCDRDVYQTWYTYDIDRWVYSRSVPTSGTQRDDPAPYWGEFSLNCANQTLLGCERENHRSQTYLVFFKDEEGKIKKYEENSQDDWNQYQFGTNYTLRVNHFGQIRNDPLRPED